MSRDTTSTDRVIAEIYAERGRQDAKFGRIRPYSLGADPK